MKKPDRRPGHIYRLCRTCGKEWNVSATAKPGAKYTCPACDSKQKKRSRKNGTFKRTD